MRSKKESKHLSEISKVVGLQVHMEKNVKQGGTLRSTSHVDERKFIYTVKKKPFMTVFTQECSPECRWTCFLVIDQEKAS